MEYAKYTYVLADIPQILADEGREPLFSNFDYSIITNVYEEFDHQFLESLWFKRYYFREIGAETVSRWLTYLYNEWAELCYEFADKFRIYEGEYLKDGLLDNNDLKLYRSHIFQDTPQSFVGDNDFTTSKSSEDTTIAGIASKKHKYELLTEYADKIRHIYQEFVDRTEDLFMQVF